ncbi:unnamed protein product [Penicillium salamii]|uniref:Nuclear transport factor 2 n=1 Tax=Penicillium salamii TaxID=1612424 RepID=A0A9W4K523_9EURO|nr:unnamed protein product [Penicillium salamii]CAG7990634.1 unnamed protein product [Penicillium salamii]CAG8155071.1 unnamed protein product [Penicillium salamii]CAG8181001.1 unnamed protein product [Penicillium salamii]CAG8288058.1 unnamed protein product [Penicillium salamii]
MRSHMCPRTMIVPPLTSEPTPLPAQQRATHEHFKTRSNCIIHLQNINPWTLRCRLPRHDETPSCTGKYLQKFDTDSCVFTKRDHSMLTFETSSIQGAKGIVEKLSSLPFKKVEHKVSSLDAQPSDSGAIVILLTGTLLIDEESAMNYTQLFELFPENGSYFVLNDIFRLIYSH